MQSDMLAAQSGYRVAIRNRTDVNATWRIKWEGRILNIRHPGNGNPRDLYLVLETESGVAT